jgi:hypothetical protein
MIRGSAAAPGDRRHRHRGRPARCRLPQPCALHAGWAWSALQAAGRRAIDGGQRHRVVDQHHRTRSQHRHAGQARHARELRAQVLDHHLLVAQHFVHVHRNALRPALRKITTGRCFCAGAVAGAGRLEQRHRPSRTAACSPPWANCAAVRRPAPPRRREPGARFPPDWTERPWTCRPVRSITTCVTAVVSGTTSLNCVPLPQASGGLDTSTQGVDFGAHHVQPDAASRPARSPSRLSRSRA